MTDCVFLVNGRFSNIALVHVDMEALSALNEGAQQVEGQQILEANRIAANDNQNMQGYQGCEYADVPGSIVDTLNSLI